MHETLTKICAGLENVAARVKTTVPNENPFSNKGWDHPGLTSGELTEEAEKIIALIKAEGGDDLGEHDARLHSYVSRLDELRDKTIGQLSGGNCVQAISAYLLTLQGLRKALDPVLTQDGRAEAASRLKRIAKQLRGIESTLKDLDPRATELNAMIERIEQAHEAADQLPTDLDALSEARASIANLVKDATRDQGAVLLIKEATADLDSQLNEIKDDANAVLQRCETAYSAVTNVGLALAFSQRSSTLSRSMWFWTGGLVAALAAGTYFGSAQLHSLTDLFKTPDVPTSLVLLNLLLSLLSVGAPVWFAWLATKQIGQRFRLSEDYAFKAAISRAYEGFRREAARIDKDMEAKLLQSALARLDELPLRLVETDNHGSPWQELASSTMVKNAIRSVPGFSEQIKDFASKALATATVSRVHPPSTPSGEAPPAAGKAKEGEA